MSAKAFLVLSAAFAGALGDAEVPPPDPSLKLVLVAMRHGYRGPCTIFKDAATQAKLSGVQECMLVDMGQKQAFGMGTFLRERYGALLGGDLAGAVSGIASTAARAKDTLTWLLKGLAAGSNDAYGPDLPEPSQFDQREDKVLLRAYAISDCPVNSNGWKAVDDESLDFINQDKEDNRELLEYVNQFTNTSEYGFLNALDYGNLGDIADNIAILRDMGQQLPEWSTNNEAFPNITERLIFFQDAAQFACAKHPPCRNAMAGYWLDFLLKKAQEGAEGDGTKLIAMTSHSETTLSLMRLIGFADERLEFSAGLVAEVSVVDGEPRIAFFYHGPPEHGSGKDEFAREFHPASWSVPPCDAGGNGASGCPLDEVESVLAGRRIPDLLALCQSNATRACNQGEEYDECGAGSSEPTCDSPEQSSSESADASSSSESAECNLGSNDVCVCAPGNVRNYRGDCVPSEKC